MPCDDRQLSQAQRAAGFQQQRAGVRAAVRQYTQPRYQLPPGMQDLIDYINRELVPTVQQTRDAVNDVYLPVMDQAPSANPLGYYFATETANGDPTPGRVRLDQASQETATTIRVSEENGRLQNVGVFLDIMAGSATTPLGVVTLVDAINPGRYIRFDLTSVTDQGDYWDLAVVPSESSHENPFVEGEAVVLAFMPGAASAGATVPIDALEPALTGAAGDGLVWDAGAQEFDVGAGDGIDVLVDSVAVDVTDIVDNVSITEVATNNIQRAALTGAIAASAGANATVFSGIRDNGAAENDRTNLNVLSTTSIIAAIADDAGNDELEITHQRAALTGAIAAALNANATVFSGIRDNGAAENDRTNLNVVNSTSINLAWTDDAGNDELELTAQRAALTGVIDAALNSNATTSAEPFVTYSASANMSAERVATSSTSVTVSTGVASQIEWQRAALTGAIAASANANATVFSGIRASGAAQNDRGNLNFVSGPNGTTSVSVGDDAGNDELEISWDVNTAANFTWTGTHTFTATAEFDALVGFNSTVATAAGQTFNFGGAARFDAIVRFNGAISPTALAADANNYNPTGWSTANAVRLSTSGGNRTITGAVAGASGEVKLLINLGPGTITLPNEDGGSTNVNRFVVPHTSVVLHVNDMTWIWYDSVSTRWRAIKPV